MKLNEISLFKQDIKELTESDLIALCHLNGFEPEELEYLNLRIN